MLFIHAPSALFLLGGYAGFYIKNNWKDLVLALSGVFGYRYKNSVEASQALRLNANLYNRFLTFGLIGTILGLAIMFAHMDNPDALGPGMAMALITSFYTVFVLIIINASATAARRQLQWFGEDEKPNYLISPTGYVLLVFGLILASFFILLFVFSVRNTG